MSFISIVTPVYNTAQYLPRCIESVLNQSFRDFELLLVDDGSTDGSGGICDRYENKDNRIRVFHKKNGGVSSARNLGIVNAFGEWLLFVDSDDELPPKALQTLVDCISDDVDSVLGGIVEVNENGDEWVLETTVEQVLSKKQTVVSLYGGYGSYYTYCGYICIWLLRKSVISDHSLAFDPSIAIKEDSLFLMQFVCKSKGFTRQTTTPVYRYYKRPDSAMGSVSSGYNPKYVDSFYALVKMKHEVDRRFSFFSTPVFVAKQAIFIRYHGIIARMDENLIQDEVTKKKLYAIMRNEVGPFFLFSAERKVRKLLRIIRNKQNNRILCITTES